MKQDSGYMAMFDEMFGLAPREPTAKEQLVRDRDKLIRLSRENRAEMALLLERLLYLRSSQSAVISAITSLQNSLFEIDAKGAAAGEPVGRATAA